VDATAEAEAVIAATVAAEAGAVEVGAAGKILKLVTFDAYQTWM
jgi:hypothetical protein